MDREELRHQSYEAWERMARGWEMAVERIEASATPVREWLLRELAPRRGDVVLELAAGPGETGFAAAAAVGEQGHVISSDRSPAMVEVGACGAGDGTLATPQARKVRFTHGRCC